MAAKLGGQDGWEIERCYLLDSELELTRNLVKDRER